MHFFLALSAERLCFFFFLHFFFVTGGVDVLGGVGVGAAAISEDPSSTAPMSELTAAGVASTTPGRAAGPASW